MDPVNLSHFSDEHDQTPPRMKDYGTDLDNQIHVVFNNPNDDEVVQNYRGFSLLLGSFRRIKPVVSPKDENINHYFNDELINLYAKLLMERCQSENMFILDSNFGNLLKNDGKDYDFNTVARFGVDYTRSLSSFDEIYFPANYQLHWLLFVLNLKKNKITIWNSLTSSDDDCALLDLTDRVKRYAKDSGLMKADKFEDIHAFTQSKAPRQPNGYDCGLFTINYLRHAFLCSADVPNAFRFSRMDFAKDILKLSINTTNF